MGNYKNKALTTGCSGASSCEVKTELMDMEIKPIPIFQKIASTIYNPSLLACTTLTKPKTGYTRFKLILSFCDF